MSFQLKALELLGAKEHLRDYLNDLVNWVEFIRRYDMAKDEQRYWRNYFGLEHTFENEIEL
ncbi:hypothetical protein [Vibrio ostreae]|uniref:Uncharacterized protein n=1 Tax=Vibrio ostreae TaxID=2841925 RepID=A0A975UEC0_9VIBR|nr:hypothetical protein [Vibrio ostreae]QXO19196.1 hypothetical protein KNV97_13495 [Vibrio ostreae]